MKFNVGDIIIQDDSKEVFRILKFRSYDSTRSFIIKADLLQDCEGRVCAWRLYGDAELHPTLNSTLGKILYGEK